MERTIDEIHALGKRLQMELDACDQEKNTAARDCLAMAIFYLGKAREEIRCAAELRPLPFTERAAS